MHSCMAHTQYQGNENVQTKDIILDNELGMADSDFLRYFSVVSSDANGMVFDKHVWINKRINLIIDNFSYLKSDKYLRGMVLK